jgi:signal transduction histidine kinase/DNA-binding response OmpR family regulator
MSTLKHIAQQDIFTELRLSPLWIVFGLIVLNLAVGLADISGPGQAVDVQMLIVALVLTIAAAAIGLLAYRHKAAACWLALVTPLSILYGSSIWFAAPALLILAPVFVVLAVALIGLRAATMVAVGETALLYLTSWQAFAQSDPLRMAVNVAAIWMILGGVAAIYLPLRAYVNRAQREVDRVHQLLEESRNRDADLARTMGDLMHAYRELDLLNERMAAMRFLAEDALRAKASFVAKVSHEFRTPLNMIIGLTDLLLERPWVYGSQLPHTLLEDLEIVHRNCKHLADLIDDVLDLSRAEAGSMSLHRTWCDLRQTCRAAVEVVQPLIEKKGLGLQVAIPADLPQTYCDETRIRQVIVNLLSNAARYTQVGEIALCIHCAGNTSVVSVADTGPGIAPEEMVKIFEPFHQGVTTAAPARSGSGLGLSISKQLVELHDGELWVESTPGKGSTFHFSLPINPPLPPVNTAGRWIRDEWMWLDVRGRQPAPKLPPRPRLLVCDRTGHLSSLFSHCSDEIEFLAVTDLEQAINMLARFPSHALVLNSATHDELLSLVKEARQRVMDTPIIGCALPSYADRVLAAGAVDYLIKPVALSNLVQILSRIDRPLRRVLTIDDDPNFQILLLRMLSAFDESLEIVQAYDGEQALVAMCTQRVDLVFLDIMLPKLNGWDVLERARTMQVLGDIPVVVLSAQDAIEQPLVSSLFMATMGDRLTVKTLLRCSLAISDLLLSPHRAEPV